MKQSTSFALQVQSYTTRYMHALQGAVYQNAIYKKRAYEKTSYAQQPSDFPTPTRRVLSNREPCYPDAPVASLDHSARGISAKMIVMVVHPSGGKGYTAALCARRCRHACCLLMSTPWGSSSTH
jgi:hypothetical protein